MPAQEYPVYRFADCELDPHEHRLLAHGNAVTLTPKVFETLVLLVERSGHVVSKDELMAALWPRGFVHESNLTKHIWLIRRALGDGEDDSRYIETVPKLGYRFVAPVQRVARAETAPGNLTPVGGGAPRPDAPIAHDAPVPAGAAAADASSNGPAIRRGDRVWLTAIGLMLVALLGGLYWWRAAGSKSAIPWSAADSGAVAIVDFNNLSGNAKDGWIGPALEQMLATEVAADGKLHAIPEELVRPARADLPAPDAGGYAPASLATLQRKLGAHYVLSGAYLVSGDADAPQLRVDLTVQDAQGRESFASLSHTAAVSDLPRLIALVGGELRGRFGDRTADPASLKQIAAAQPPTSEVARHLGFALQALDQYDAARARDELLQVIAQAPGYAPAYLHLARAWSMLGYRGKAVAASKQAAQYMDGLPRETQLQIRAQQTAQSGDTAQTVALRSELLGLRPHNPDYRLQWIAALVKAAKYDDAQSALRDARALPELDRDPRVELAAAHLELARNNYAAATTHARLALAQARQRGETGLIAEAELQSGIALDQAPEAESLLRAAAADYRRIGNPHGEALAWQNLANFMDSRNQITLARETYQRAMTIYQGVGDLGGEAAIYDNLSRMLWSAGDRDGTEAALRQALAIGRETNDPVRQAWSLTGLATVLTDESASDEALSMYGQAIELDRQSGERAHLAFALSYYADLLRVRGQLDAARDACAQARTVAGERGDASLTMAADFECAQIALDRGEVDAAVTSLESLESKAIAGKDDFDAANAQLVLGQIDMGRRQWRAARDALRKSLQGWAAQKETPGEATTQALLALCDSALGDTAARDQAAARARDLRGRITQRQEVLYLDIALAELQADAGRPDAALASLHSLTDAAARRHWLGYAFEARLATQWVMERRTDHGGAKVSRDTLAADAREAGFGWVGLRLAAMSTPRGTLRSP